MRSKIDYGIDLGTTNSAIARIEHGDAIIKKTDLQKDTMPSCVGFNKRQKIFAGDQAFQALKSEKAYAMEKWKYDPNFFIEFKRTMGTNTMYKSSNMNKEFDSEELSAEVLKKLKSFISDEAINSAVITVPAMFTSNQKEATVRAAKLAGINQVELLQEPIAASLAYGLSPDSSDGYWLIFDFGGGTFDTGLLHVEDGIIQVKDTAGDNRLGGKNLDEAIVDSIIIPHLQSEFIIKSILSDDNKSKILKEAMKRFAEDVKIQMSFKDTGVIESQLGEIKGKDDNGEEMDLYIEINQSKMKEILGPVFQRAIDVSKDLLKRNNLSGTDLSSLLLVGGPTYSPVLRSMLSEQICQPDTSVDPMTAVAKGAAIYASTISISEENIVRDKLKVQLTLGYESTSVEEEEMVAIKIDTSKTESNIPATLFVELENVDGTWSSGKSEIGPKGEIVKTALNLGKSNTFKVLITDHKGDPVDCQPSEISIIQGTKVGSAVLPYHMGIEIYSRSSEMMIFNPSKGLEKNKPIPATGINHGLKTTKILRPGVKDDIMKVAIYQGEHNTEGTRAIYNHHVSDIVITGLDVENTIPEGADVEITIKIDRSEKLQFIAFFPSVNETFEVKVPILRTDSIPESRIEEKLDEAIYDAERLEHSSDVTASSKAKKVKESLTSIKERWNGNRSDDDRKHETMENVKKEMRTIDELKDNTSWESIESELRSELERLEKAQSEVGGVETKHIVNEVRSQVDRVIREKNPRMAKALISDMGSLHFEITRIYQYINFFRFFDNDFDSISWRGDRSRARNLVSEGIRIINGNPTLDALQPIITQIIQNHYPKQSLPGGIEGGTLTI